MTDLEIEVATLRKLVRDINQLVDSISLKGGHVTYNTFEYILSGGRGPSPRSVDLSVKITKDL